MLNMLLDFIPVLLFFIAFKWYGIYTATVVGIVATGLQVLMTRVWKKRFDKQQVITFIVFVIFGGMTLYFHNPIFVKWKPSIVFWAFGLVLLITQVIGKKPLVERMLSHLLEEKGGLPSSVWRRLNLAWAIFFILMGMINIFIAYSFSTDTWVNFKLYGIMGLLFLFSIFQALYLSRHLTGGKS